MVSSRNASPACAPDARSIARRARGWSAPARGGTHRLPRGRPRRSPWRGPAPRPRRRGRSSARRGERRQDPPGPGPRGHAPRTGASRARRPRLPRAAPGRPRSQRRAPRGGGGFGEQALARCFTDGDDRRAQRVDGAPQRRQIRRPGRRSIGAAGRDPQDPPVGLAVSRCVSADARVVPVGHVDLALRPDRHVARPEPLAGLTPGVLRGADQHVLLERDPRPLRSRHVGVDHTRARVAVEHSAVETLGQERPS